MKTIVLACLWVEVLLIGGCSTMYKQMARYEVEAGAVRVRDYLAYKNLEESGSVKSATNMTNLDANRQPGEFSVSKDYLVYQAVEERQRLLETRQEARSNLWLINVTGEPATTQLTAGNYLDIEPMFGPDGKKVYFASNRSSQHHKISAVATSGGGGIERITQGEAEDRCPALPRTSDRVFYSSRLPDTPFQIWHITSDGRLPTQLKVGWRPRVSPDGNTLLYASEEPITKKEKICTMAVDGTDLRQLRGTDGDDVHPSWSPDGGRIVFASNSNKDVGGHQNFDIYVMSASGAGAAPRQLTTNGATDIMPQFSVDGKYIYFLSNRGFAWNIWRIEIDEPDRKTPAPAAGQPTR